VLQVPQVCCGQERAAVGRFDRCQELVPEPASCLIGAAPLIGLVSQHLGIEAGFLLLGLGHAAICVLQLMRLRAAP
jgi:hypothetical protein